MTIVRPHLLGPDHPGCRKCLGTEPRGDLERKLQDHIEKLQGSKKKKDKKDKNQQDSTCTSCQQAMQFEKPTLQQGGSQERRQSERG